MSETKSPTPEIFNNPEIETSQLEAALLKEKLEAAKSQEADSPNVEAARATIDQLAQPISRELPHERSESPADNTTIHWVSSELRSQALDRMLSSVRNRLSAPEKNLSKIIHQPVVEKISDAASKSIVRPSGVLFGGIFSFIGSLTAYLVARHLGGELRYSIFAVSFLGGFIVGLIIEFFWRMIQKRRVRSN